MADLPHNAHANCPIGDLLARLGDKWSMLVLVTLARADNHCLRFSELMRQIDGISQRMLTTTLRHLERDGILTRQIYPEVPPRVEYTVTGRGREMLIPVEQLVHWIVQEWPEIEKSRTDYDARNSKIA
jgi:DNA-binding HxlR family transcriptional regulator